MPSTQNVTLGATMDQIWISLFTFLKVNRPKKSCWSRMSRLLLSRRFVALADSLARVRLHRNPLAVQLNSRLPILAHHYSASVTFMSAFTSLWRVWIGIVLVLFFGVPVFSVLLWITGGILGLVVLIAIAVFVLIYLFSKKPE